MALYTPFLAESAGKISNSMLQRQAGELSKRAYLGDEQALGDLYRLDPNQAAQIRTQRMQEEQAKLARGDQEQRMQQSAQQFAMQNHQFLQGLMSGAANFGTFEEAQGYLDSQLQGARQSGVRVPESMSAQTFTPEDFQQIKQAYGQQQAPIKMGDDTLLDPNTYQPLWEKQKTEDFNKPFLSDGSPNPAYQQYQQGLRVAGAPQTTIKMPESESEASKSYGKGIGDRANARIDAASNAQAQNMSLEQMAEALEAGASTGFGQETLATVKNAAQSLFGIQLGDNVGEQEVVKAIQNRLALEIRNPTSGMGLPGGTSNKDIDFLIGAVPGLQRSPQGNALLIDYFVKVNDFKQDVATEQQRIIDENNGVVPNNLDSQLMRYINNYRLLEDSERSQLDNLAKASEGLSAEEQAEYDALVRELGIGN